MERKKIELRSASAAIGTTSTFARGGSVKDAAGGASSNPNPTPGPGAAGQRKGG